MVPVVKLNALTGACDPGTFLYKAGVAWLAGAYRDLSPGSALVDPIAGTNLPLSARTCLQDCASPWLGAKFPTSTYAREPGAAVSVDRDFCALGAHGLFRNPVADLRICAIMSLACYTLARVGGLCGVGVLRLQPRSYSNLNIINTLLSSVQG